MLVKIQAKGRVVNDGHHWEAAESDKGHIFRVDMVGSVARVHVALEQQTDASLLRPAASVHRDMVRSGLAAARARGVKLGRLVGQRPSDKKAKCVLGMHADGLSYRLIARNVGLSKNMVMDIVRRNTGEHRA